MLNRGLDRERGCPFLFCWLFETNHRNGANFHVPSSLVWFRELPPPRPLIAVIFDFFLYAGESASPFYIKGKENNPVSRKENEKPG